MTTHLGNLFVISAPSGGGKTSLVSALLEKLADIRVSISHTTRAPRLGEKEGVNYFYVSEDQFIALEKQGQFLESAHVFDKRYGTSKGWVMQQLDAGIDVILDIDWQGMHLVKSQLPLTSIFILPPSRDALYQRLKERQDSVAQIEDRMSKASREISHYKEYDYVIVNDNFDDALQDLLAIVRSQRLRLKNQLERHQALLQTLQQQ